ncbi:carbamoyltransferase HypF [Methylohalobius crimeensis]|uniref:carbamoyltransferase HypF n=1 Tax=Methylohalobius crimeensis TaxID=244365 RepID=UPI0003B2F946|nr:carbamoyltransferase HypF [Methylohalobius crimeensis]
MAPCDARDENREAGGERLTGLETRIHGLVQGVGFRPAVWRLASRYGLTGSVSNTGAGLRIEVWGTAASLAEFQRELRENPPPLARIERVIDRPLHGPPPRGDFIIQASGTEAPRTSVPPDAAICPDCLKETFDPAGRRHRYPFTHCTHCGPRFTVIHRLPYDREHTGMAGFPLCSACRTEYEDPSDRRFHAQATACPDCGPKVWLTPEDAIGDAAVKRCVRLLRQGKIIAVKGLGGFQLMADATRPEAVTALRARKHRPHKPLALMARDLAVVRRYARVDPEEERALASTAAPIVLLQGRGRTLPKSVAPGLALWGFVLPYTPLHHLLLETFDHPLVFTSGNVSGDPLCADNEEALERLTGIADAFLLHDRPIVHPCDDSVVCRMAGRMRILRRARGYAPAPVSLPPGFEQSNGILALGGELKNSFCLVRDGQAILSQYLGDLEQARSYGLYRRELAAYQDLFGFEPRCLAVDMHPEYLSTKLGRTRAAEKNLPLTEVQHHHAHLAACLAEHGHPQAAGPVLGLILDGLGYGGDGTFWGGELLWADYRTCRRLAHLKAVPLPGGGKAMIEPWRNLAAQLWQAGIPLEAFPGLRTKPLPALRKMLETGLGSPPASSCGRLFDAAAAAFDLRFDTQSYEGQAAAELERWAWQSDERSGYSFSIRRGETWIVDPSPLWPAVLADLAARVPKTIMARRFHLGLADAWCRVIGHFAERMKCPMVVLSGGVFQNRLLLETTTECLRDKGLRVWIPQQVPMNDGGLALGQAVIVAARG